MAKEIERKFLVVDDSYRSSAVAVKDIRQGYLSNDPDATVRVRIADDKAFITIKTRNHGCVRNEWEFGIDASEAEQLLGVCRHGVIVKKRYIVPAPEGLKWEVDVFGGRLEGLVIAEIELPDENMEVTLPSFIGKEVTGDSGYYNSSLASASADD